MQGGAPVTEVLGKRRPLRLACAARGRGPRTAIAWVKAPSSHQQAGRSRLDLLARDPFIKSSKRDPRLARKIDFGG